VQLIAEAGVTHGNNLKTALELADEAKKAGADVIKYQNWVSDKYLRRSDPDYFLLKKLELSFEDTKAIARHCEDIKIEFMSTPDELDSLKFLVEVAGVRRIKIGSANLTDKSLLDTAYQTGLPVILSTGMCTLQEIERALPHDSGFVSVTLMHCMSLYPCPPQMANLNYLNDLKKFGYPVGYSDHCPGFMASYLSLPFGVSIVEKHFCPGGYDGIDKDVSLHPPEMRLFIAGLHEYEKMLGSKLNETRADRGNISKYRKDKDGKRGLKGE